MRSRIPDQPLHLLQRGVNRAACFACDGDRLHYMDLLQESAAKRRCAVHAFVLMTNHVHLLVTPEDPEGASHLMKDIGERYVRYFNRRHGRTGTLWEGRFKSSDVTSDAYVLTCQRYIELNPARAGMVRHPREYVWSSYRANAEGQPSSLIVPHRLYGGLGTEAAQRHRGYRTLFDVPITEEEMFRIREAVRSNKPLRSPQPAAAAESDATGGEPGAPHHLQKPPEGTAIGSSLPDAAAVAGH
jgi:putative transposase